MFTVKYNHNLIKIQQESNAITSGIVIAILRLYMINLNISCMRNTFCGDLGSLENLLGRKDVGPSQKVNISGPITITASTTFKQANQRFQKFAFSVNSTRSVTKPILLRFQMRAFSKVYVFIVFVWTGPENATKCLSLGSLLVVGPLASVGRQPTKFNEGFFNVELLSQSSSVTSTSTSTATSTGYMD